MYTEKPKNFLKLKNRLVALLLLFATIGATQSSAEEHRFENYTVHYNLLNSSLIEPKIATQYGIKRSKNIALLNISVIEDSDQPEGKPVIANVFGHGASLAGQLKQLAFKEVKEGSAIYYLATFPINNGERLSFDLQVQPNKKGKLIPIKFKRQVYLD